MIERLSLPCGDWLWRRIGLPPVTDWLQRLFAAQPVAPLLVAAGATSAEALDALLAQEVRRAAPSPELVEAIPCALSPAASPEQPQALDTELLRTWLGAPGGDREHHLGRLASACARAAQIAWFEVPQADVSEVHEAARRVLNAVRALAPEACVGVGLLVRGRPAGDPIPLDQAWPTDAAPDVTDPDPWARYVHLRLAWHVGGQWARAQDATRLPRIADDGALSQALDALSARWFDALPPATQAALVEADPDRLEMCLAEHNLLMDRATGWMGPPMPTPWVARALLCRVAQHPARRQLRAAEACRPWNRELLDRCLWLEALARDRLVPDEEAPPRDNALDRDHIFTRFAQGWGAEARFMLDQHEANPLEPLDFHSLGQAGYHASRGLRDSLLTGLRHLRNVLAHGHAVGWAAHEELERLEGAAVRLR